MSQVIEKLHNPAFWREKCLTDLYFLNRVILCTLEDPTPGYKDLYRPTHKKMCDFVQTHAQPGHKVLLFCPRGWVKSYLITVGWMTQRLLQQLVAQKHVSAIISNATFDNAKHFLKKVKYNLQYNDLLRGLFADVLPRFPETEAPRWTMDEIEIGGTSIEVGSVEGNLVSRHYGIMLHDDLVNKDNAATPEQILKVVDWWKLAQSLLESYGLELLIGTRWKHEDLYGYIIENHLKIPEKVLQEAKKQPVFEYHRGQYHMLTFKCWEDPVREKGSTFPILYPESRLKEIQETQAEHFGGQYLNDPESEMLQKFKRSWLKVWKSDELPAQKIVFQLMDPSGKATRTTDETGHVVVDAGVDRNLYVRYAARRRVTDSKAVEWLIETACIHQSDVIGVESNKFNVFRELAEFLVPQMVRSGQIPKHMAEYAARISYRMVELKPASRPKSLRIENITGMYEQGRIYLAPTGMEALIQELLRHPSDRDNVIDALAYITDVVVYPQRTDPPKSLIVPEELKMTPEEREQREWEEQAELAAQFRDDIEEEWL